MNKKVIIVALVGVALLYYIYTTQKGTSVGASAAAPGTNIPT